jgi:predicted nucleic acid-binding protein
MSYVLDTSVVTRLRSAAVAERVRELDLQGIRRTSLTDLEIGFSARNDDEWDRLIAALETFHVLPVEEWHLVRAGQVQRLLAGAGLRGRKIPDLVVAAVAEAAACTVLHYDADFDHIAEVTGQPVEWIVPRGSID